EWNGRYRDSVRDYWRGAAHVLPELAGRLAGSADIYQRSGRRPCASVNFVTAHDGFTLADLVAYNDKHNEANGEDNRDGHSENHSDNLGVEGPSADPLIVAARGQRKRNLLATLLLSQGTPMLLAGDELGHSQGGNNNAYAQDNETTWIDWAHADGALAAFVARLVALRRAHPVLRQRRFLHGGRRHPEDQPDVIWRHADGRPPEPAEWHDPAFRCLCLELRMAAQAPAHLARTDVIFAVFNAGAERALTLPDTEPAWRLVLDTSRPLEPEGPALPGLTVPANAILVFTAALGGAPT
ncbi:MAG: glycogen debranching enzyme, partial [Rhodobacterales bacterium 17-64-5]